MPRTIEHIVDTHRHAQELRRAGQPIWPVTLRFKALMEPYRAVGDSLTKEQAVEMSHKIAALLKAGVPAAWRDPHNDNYNMDFEDLFERFEQAAVSDFQPIDGFPAAPVDGINSWIDELYDWADRHRVWLGL